jgi:hypothetical protein
VRLGGVLEQLEAMPVGDRAQWRHVGGLAVEMDGDDRARARADRRFDARGVDVAGGLVGLHRYRRRAGLAHREPGRDEGVRRNDHLVAGADAPGAQHEVQRVEAVADADRVGDAAVRGELALEGVDLGAEDVAARSEDALARLAQRRRVRRVDAAEVEERQGDQCFAHRARMNSA